MKQRLTLSLNIWCVNLTSIQYMLICPTEADNNLWNLYKKNLLNKLNTTMI